MKIDFSKQLLDESPDAIIFVNPAGRIVHANSQAEAVFDYSREELIGQSIEVLLPGRFRSVHVAHRSNFFAQPHKRTMGTGLELYGLRKNGSEFPVEISLSPLETDEGKLVMSVIRDITERKRADEEILRSKQELVDFVEYATIGMHWVNPEGTILWANQTEMQMLGYAPDEYIRHNITEFHTDIDIINDYLQRLKRNETLRNCEATLRCKDGSFRYVQIDSNALWEDGRFIHSRCFTRDITEQKLAEKALQDSEQRLRAALAEREQLSRDLHDGIVQEIYAIGLGLEEAQRLVAEHASGAERKISDAIASLNEVIREVRKHIIGSAPQVLTGQQLRSELTAFTKTMRNAHSLRFRFDINAMAVSRLSDDAAPHVLNIAREAISNSLRHSEGRSGFVSLQPYRDGVRLIVEDDGSGFILEAVRARGQGLRNIEARAGQLAAKLHIRSGAGYGTRIVLDIPASHADAAV